MAQVVLVKLLMPQGDSLFQLIGEKCGLGCWLIKEKRRKIYFMDYFGGSIQNTVDVGACSDGGIAGLLGQPAAH